MQTPIIYGFTVSLEIGYTEILLLSKKEMRIVLPPLLLPIILLSLLSMGTAVTAAFALEVEIPTYSDKPPITGPNGTEILVIPADNSTINRLAIPFINGTEARIDIAEYQTCVDKDNEMNLRTHREAGLNTLDPFVKESLKNISMIAMQNCIYLNSANQ